MTLFVLLGQRRVRSDDGLSRSRIPKPNQQVLSGRKTNPLVIVIKLKSEDLRVVRHAYARLKCCFAPQLRSKEDLAF